jgi:hypothetical protein
MSYRDLEWRMLLSLGDKLMKLLMLIVPDWGFRLEHWHFRSSILPREWRGEACGRPRPSMRRLLRAGIQRDQGIT